jgi:NTP pyrophosphatase (non-canonical NTP hydrolase)
MMLQDRYSVPKIIEIKHFVKLQKLLYYGFLTRNGCMKKYQEELDLWFKKNGWKYWSPLSILARLFEECGEFARVVNHLFGDKPKRSEEKEQELGEEMGDIIYTLICFANSQGIDLDSAIQGSIDKVIKRDKDRFTKS